VENLEAPAKFRLKGLAGEGVAFWGDVGCLLWFKGVE